MVKNKLKKNKSNKWLSQFRLVILNEETFEERFAMRLTRLNVFVAGSLLAIFLVGITILIISYTPLKEYIPGHASLALQKRAVALGFKTDSLATAVNMNDQYIKSVKRVLRGDVSAEKFNKDSIIAAAELDVSEIQLSPSKEDSLLRVKVEKEDKYNLFERATLGVDLVLFPPAIGPVSSDFSIEDKHYAVDIVLSSGTPIKATATGRVLFSEWTYETGYVIIIDHGNSLLSVYKHNSLLTKAQGDFVSAGEVIAMSGGSGELSSGPHLHFELWNNRYPINPSEFIDFK